MQRTERFEVVFEAKESFWQTNVPIIAEETVILADKQTGKKYIRNSFRNMSDKAISAIMISIACKDVWGNELESNGTFQYLDLKVGENCLFGLNEPIEVKNCNTRSVTSLIQKVLFADGSVIECQQEGVYFPKPSYLSVCLNNQELIEEYARETATTAKYVPAEFDEYWRCTCGGINQKENSSCKLCGSDFHQLCELLNVELLSSNLQIYKKQQAEKEEAERIAELKRVKEAEQRAAEARETLQIRQRVAEKEKAAERRSQAKKRIILISIISIIVFLFLYFVFIGPQIINPMKTYKEACDSLANEQYETAISLFKEIPDYKDSSELIDEAKYCQGKHLMDTQQYALAVSKFEEISHYKDSKSKVLECKYGYVSVNNNNNNLTTFEYLKELKSIDYKDSSKIYSNLYAWKIEMYSCNTNKDDYSTNNFSISKYCRYFHANFKLLGGTPNERINLTHSVIYPGGTTHDSTWDWEGYSNGNTFGLEYKNGLFQNPKYEPNGYLIISIYNSDTHKCIDSVTIKITD